MKIKNYFILLATLIIISITNVKANTIYNIDVDVDINKQGNANITETWRVKGSDGTEWYHPFRDLESGNHEIFDYTVTMDGKTLTRKNWNISESLSQKSGYYGINYNGQDTELCFGKGDFNSHTFALKYTVSNIIFNTTDAQVMYWTFFPKFQDVDFQNYKVTIKSYYDFPDTLDVWGFGYKGYAYVNNNVISLSNSEDSDMNDQYSVALVKFPQNTFETTNTYSYFNSFDDVLSAAKEGTWEYDYDEEELTTLQKIINFIKTLFWLIVPIAIGIISAISASKNGYGYKNNKVIDKKTLPNFRDIPCHKDIYYANALLFLNNFEYKETNILGAIILKWVKQEKVKFVKQATGLFKKETSCLDLRIKPTFTPGDKEEKLYNIMYEASEDGILEPKEFGKWVRKSGNYSTFFDIFKDFKEDEISKLRSENHIYYRTAKEECKKKNVMDDTIYEDSKQLYGLKKFLQEFSSINTKETLEVHIWEEYLMFAYLFGIADKVATQLKNLYPELLEQNQNMDYTTIMMINNFSTTTVNAASSARSAAQNYNSGGGGFSVGGGGFGAGGGGGFSGGGSR